MSDYFSADMGSLWVQPSGPNTTPYYLGCHGIDDITEPFGDISVTRCPDPSRPGSWKIVLSSREPADRPTFSISTLVGKVADYLEGIKCPAAVYVKQADCGRKDLFLNYQRFVVLPDALISERTQSNLASRDTADPAEQSFSFSSDDVIEIYPLLGATQTTTEANDLTDISFCNSFQCRSDCGPFTEECVVGFITTEAGAAVTANVLYTDDGGVTWTASAADPFDADVDLSTVVCFEYTKDVTRVIVGRGTLDGGAASVSYSDNNGTTWVEVDLPGSANDDFLPWNGSLFALDLYHVWAGTDDGLIYFSDDGGVTWEQQSSTSAAAINSVRFIDKNYGIFVGAGNMVYSTEDGGDHWTNIGGPAAEAGIAAMACDIIDSNFWWVGYADGNLYYTMDGGTNWYERVFAITGAATIDRINDIKFIDDQVGYMATLYTDGAAAKYGALMRTFDGGFNWEAYRTSDVTTDFDTDETGLAAVWPCTHNKAFAVGDLVNALGLIMVVNPPG